MTSFHHDQQLAINVKMMIPLYFPSLKLFLQNRTFHTENENILFLLRMIHQVDKDAFRLISTVDSEN
jgi:hypothetical protein